MGNRNYIREKKRIVVKIGSSSLTHQETGALDLRKLELLVRVLTDMRNKGKEVILVSSGAIAVGRKKLKLSGALTLAKKQACAAVGQAQLMMVYQRIFSEYNQSVAQLLLTKITMINDVGRTNAINTFNELLKLGVIPIVNENDTVSTYEMEKLIEFGDNDRLSAIVASLTNADLLILLSDIDGLFTDDPNINKDARFIEEVPVIDQKLIDMGKSTSSSSVGTGGMASKLVAAQIATYSNTDMIIANGDDIHVIEKIMDGENIGTLFKANSNESFNVKEFL
ncbi:MAG: glutamate 5-kinase [Lachnospiraceae bacterium]